MTSRCSLNAFRILAKDRAEKGFNAVQIVVGAPPETPIFSKNAANAGGTAFNRDGTLNLQYFEEVDKKIKILLEYNLTPYIVGSWGPHMDILGEKAIRALWSEIIDRYHSLGVVWCVCGEADLTAIADIHNSPFAQHKNRLKTAAPKLYALARSFYRFMNTSSALSASQNKRIIAWNRMGSFIAGNDPSHNPITIHTHSPQRASQLFNNPDWLSIDTIQTGHSYDTRRLIRVSALSAAKENRPFINLEPWYEGILGQFPDKDQRYAFWISMLSGAQGHAYGAHGIWNMGSEDNFLDHWGVSNWKRAIDFPGALQLGMAKKFLQNLKVYDSLKPLEGALSPEWSTKDPMQPIAAKTCDTLLIYVPDTSKCRRVFIKENLVLHKEAHIISPITFKKSMALVSNNSINIADHIATDIVITIKFDTIEA